MLQKQLRQTYNASMTTIVDTDALIALRYPTDALHQRAAALLAALDGAHRLLSPTTLTEFSLVGMRGLDLVGMQQTIATIVGGGMIIETVTEKDAQEATALFQQQRSKDNSLADCFVMILAKRTKADCIFSFDQGYTQNGFVLLEEFLKRE